MSAASDPLVDGATINWGRVGLIAIGGTAYAYFEGFLQVLLALADFPITALSFVANGLGALVTAYFEPVITVVTVAWQQTLGTIQSAGPLGYVVALFVVLATFYAFWQVIALVR